MHTMAAPTDKNKLIDDNPLVDIAGLMFLEDIADKQGEAGMTNYLVSLASSLAKSMPEEEYESWDRFLDSLRNRESILTTFDNVITPTETCVATYLCPFERGVSEYTARIGELPNLHKSVAEHFNNTVKPSTVNTCCVICQSYRNFAASRIKVKKKPVRYAQISVSNFGNHIQAPDEWLPILLERADISKTRLNMLERKSACTWMVYQEDTAKGLL